MCESTETGDRIVERCVNLDGLCHKIFDLKQVRCWRIGWVFDACLLNLVQSILGCNIMMIRNDHSR